MSSDTTYIKISVVVPVKNGIKTLPHLIKAIQEQSIFDALEVVVFDSGSDDGSVEFLQQYPFIRLFQIAPHEFNHGSTRNLAVQQCKGKFIWMTVQDAWPTDHLMLEKMLKHFTDVNTVAVCGQQIVPPNPKMNPHEWYRSTAKPQVYKVQFTNGNYHHLTPKQKWEAASIDNVNTVYRKSTLLAFPFKQVFWGEDMYWGDHILAQALAIVYDRSAKVNHYHYQDASYTQKHTLITKLLTYQCFTFLDRRTFDVKDYLLVVYRNFKWKLKFKWIFYNFRLIYNHRKATHYFIKCIENNTIDQLEKKLYQNIPKGRQGK